MEEGEGREGGADLGVLDDLDRVLLEGGSSGLLEGDGDTGDGLRGACVSEGKKVERREEGEERTLLWGPPWHAGKTALLTRVSRSPLSLRKKMRPARGPRRVLWLWSSSESVRITRAEEGRTNVVVVTTSQTEKGSFWT